MRGESRSGPLVTDRPTAENPGEKFTANGTPDPRQRTSSRAVVVSGVVEVDLSRHVDKQGGIWDDARYVVDRALSICPAGVAVRVRLGRALYVFDLVVDVLAEGTADARSVEIVGTYPDAVAQVVGRLRERLESVA